MFWGLIMEPQRRYSQVIRRAFHISMATLDITNADDEPAQILCGYDGKNYLLCTLQKPDKLQCNLDLYFEEGRAVSFASNGNSHVHLTGYLTKDALEGMDIDQMQEFDVGPRRNVRRREGNNGERIPNKKMKFEELPIQEEEDPDDSDFNIEKLLEAETEASEGDEDSDSASEDDMEEDEESVDEEGNDSEEDETGEEDEAEDEMEDEEEAEEEDGEDEIVEEKLEEEIVVENGVGKTSKKNKKKEQQTTPTKQNKQKEKPQLTPGPKAKKEKANSEDQKNKGKEQKKSKDNQSPVPKKRTLSHGIIVEDLRLGQGDAARNGKFVQVYYEGRLKNNNKVFDKSSNGSGFGFNLGKSEVIKGLDIGLNGMKIGGKRRIICPPHVAYGAKGSPPVIPPNATLIFDVELKKIK